MEHDWNVVSAGCFGVFAALLHGLLDVELLHALHLDMDAWKPDDVVGAGLAALGESDVLLAARDVEASIFEKADHLELAFLALTP